MRRVLLVVVVVFALASLASAANILDLIYRGASTDTNLGKQPAAVEQKQDVQDHDQEQTQEEEQEEKSCDCNGLECMCCVDFNMTFIDLGKGCVKMKYISQHEGVLLNVSYGENLLRSGMSRGPNPSSTCVSMIGQLAAICARFTSLVPHDDGLKGCLKLEPKLLGDVQTRLSVGCFVMNDEGMRLDDNIQQELDQQQQEATTVAPETSDAGVPNTNQTNAEENATGNLNEDEILAAVNESAQKGLAFFQNWLGLDFGGGANASNGTQQDETQEAQEDETGTDAAAAKQADDINDAQDTTQEKHTQKVDEAATAK